MSHSSSFLGLPYTTSDDGKQVHRLSKHFLVSDFDEELVFLELDRRVSSEFALIQPLELVDVSWQKKDKEKLAPNVFLPLLAILCG